MLKIYHFILITYFILEVLAVPPSVCRADFRWDDCGKPPKAVMYYWKQGSRCEIGIWKGCLPNVNMFADEYECINTCIFVDRPTLRTETEEPETEATASNDSLTTADGYTETTGDSSDGSDVNGTSTTSESADNNASSDLNNVSTDDTGTTPNEAPPASEDNNNENASTDLNESLTTSEDSDKEKASTDPGETQPVSEDITTPGGTEEPPTS